TRAMCEAVKSVGGDLIWLTPAGWTAATARALGLRVVEEFYADRAYHRNKTLASRKQPGAVIHDAQTIRAMLMQLFETGTIKTIEGDRVSLEFDSICVHGDTPDALEIVRLIRTVCAERNIAIRPMSELIRA